MKKILTGMLGILTAVMIAVFPVCAAEALEIYVGKYEIEENRIQVQVGSNISENTGEKEYTASLGGEELTVESVMAGQMEVSYLYLIDISGSIREENKQQIADVFNNLVAYLGPEDNASLMFVGNDAVATDFTSDKDVLVETFNKMESSHEDTNLYYGIDQAIKILETNEACYDRNCVVILSDGEDDKIDGLTFEEVETAVEESDTVICCVNLFGKNASQETIERGKLTGSLARRSPGGVNLVYGQEGLDGPAIASKVHQAAQNFSILTLSLDNYTQGNANTELTITLKIEGEGTATDSIQVNGTDLPMTAQTETEETAETQEPKEAGEETGVFSLLPVIGGAALVVLILAVLLNSRKKKKNKTDIETPEPITEEPKEAETVKEKELNVTLPVHNKEYPAFEQNAAPAFPAAPTVYEKQLTMTRMGSGKSEVLTLQIKNSLVFGRTGGLSDAAYPADSRLSGKHLRFFVNENGLFVEDLGSTNGTALNGVPLNHPRKAVSGDTIFAGSYEWRIEVKD